MKKILVGSIAALGLFILPIAASAATISTPLFSNGDTTIDATGLSTVSGTFTLQVGANEVCEVIRTQADTQPFTDTTVGGTLGYQEGTYTNVPFSVKVSPNTGTYNATAQCAGIYGGNHSIDGADNVVVGPVSLGTIRVTAGNSGSGNSGSTDALTALVAQLAAEVQAILHPVAPVAPAMSAVCTAYNQAAAGSMQGIVNSANVRLQGFLLSQGESIPALAAGAAFGFDGPQSEAARSAFLMAQVSIGHPCN